MGVQRSKSSIRESGGGVQYDLRSSGTDHLWRCRDRVCAWGGGRSVIMGVLNVTPDSFSDGGAFADADRAVARGLDMVEEGADILDVGGESARPGSDPVPAEEEIRRVVPVIEALSRRTDALISVDTQKATVAEAALRAGAHIVNDVSALEHDGDAMARVVRDSGCGCILMHKQGSPRTMQEDPRYEHVAQDVRAYLEARTDWCESAGLDRERLALDPGIGFGKTLQHNLQLIARLGLLAGLGFPIVVGLSRKSWAGAVTGRGVADRLAASLAGLVCAVERGAHILRVHDVRESLDAARVADAVRAAASAEGGAP